MKKITAKVLICTFLLMLTCFISYAKATDVSSGGIGARLFKDGRKCFVIYILPNSAAAKAYLPLGAEILEVDGQKVRKLKLEEITELIRGSIGTEVTLLVKNNGKKEIYKIARDKIVISPTNDNNTFNIHWKQIAPDGYEDVLYIRVLPQYSSAFKQYLNYNNYWAERKENFRQSFAVCKTYDQKNQDACYINLVNREISKTQADAERERQAAMMRMQAAQNFVNAMNQIQTNTNLNNINNSIQQNNFQLQQQNMQLWNMNNNLRGW